MRSARILVRGPSRAGWTTTLQKREADPHGGAGIVRFRVPLFFFFSSARMVPCNVCSAYPHRILLLFCDSLSPRREDTNCHSFSVSFFRSSLLSLFFFFHHLFFLNFFLSFHDSFLPFSDLSLFFLAFIPLLRSLIFLPLSFSTFLTLSFFLSSCSPIILLFVLWFFHRSLVYYFLYPCILLSYFFFLWVAFFLSVFRFAFLNLFFLHSPFVFSPLFLYIILWFFPPFFYYTFICLFFCLHFVSLISSFLSPFVSFLSLSYPGSSDMSATCLILLWLLFPR